MHYSADQWKTTKRPMVVRSGFDGQMPQPGCSPDIKKELAPGDPRKL
jgi:hypothetical protein